jgi:hypothetical protein
VLAKGTKSKAGQSNPICIVCSNIEKFCNVSTSVSPEVAVWVAIAPCTADQKPSLAELRVAVDNHAAEINDVHADGQHVERRFSLRRRTSRACCYGAGEHRLVVARYRPPASNRSAEIPVLVTKITVGPPTDR